MKGFKGFLGERIYLRWLFLPSHWLFQGIRGADRTERIYKLSFSLLFTAIFFLFLCLVLNLAGWQALLLAFLTAHSLNWLVNCNIMGNLIHRTKIGKTEKSQIFDYLEELSDRFSTAPSILCAAAFGSLSRGKLHANSDVDVSFIRRKGVVNGLAALRFLYSEIRLANKKRIPLEAYLGDSLEYLRRRYKAAENPVILYDPDGVISKNYERYSSLEEAKELNLKR